jgi:hypothetical protein
MPAFKRGNLLTLLLYWPWLCRLLSLLTLLSAHSAHLSAACDDYAVCCLCWFWNLLFLWLCALLHATTTLLPAASTAFAVGCSADSASAALLTLLCAASAESSVCCLCWFFCRSSVTCCLGFCCLRWLCCLLPTLTLLSAAYVDSAVCCLRWLCCPLPTLTLLSAAYVDSAFCCLRWLCCLLPTLTLLSADFLESCSLLRVSHAFSFESFYPTVSLQYSIISCFCHCVCLLCELSYSICFLLLLPGLALGLVTLDTKSGFSHLLFFPLKVKHWRIDSFLPLCVQLSQLRI